MFINVYKMKRFATSFVGSRAQPILGARTLRTSHDFASKRRVLHAQATSRLRAQLLQQDLWQDTHTSAVHSHAASSQRVKYRLQRASRTFRQDPREAQVFQTSKKSHVIARIFSLINYAMNKTTRKCLWNRMILLILKTSINFLFFYFFAAKEQNL